MEEFKEIIMEKNNNLMSGKGEKGEWKTINGAHVYVEDGQSVEEAMNKQFNKKDNGKRWNETGLHNSEKQPSKSHTLSDSDKTIVDDAIYWAKKEGKGNVKGAMEQLEADMAGFLSYGEKGNYEAVRDYMREKLGDGDSSDKVAASIDQDKIRDDKYTTGNPDNINKQSSAAEIENTLKGYKGSGSVDLVLPGGKWAQIRPQKDGTYLVRSNKGSKYVGTVDEAKKAVAGDFGSTENKVQEPKKDWSGVKTIKQAKKLDPDIVEKKLASNIIFSYGDLNISDDELADKVSNLTMSKEEFDSEKVKQFIKNNRKAGRKIFTSYQDISESFK